MSDTITKEAILTPMMARYLRIKDKLPKDTMLLLRLGDFYEMLFDDAKEGARLLNMVLTKRDSVPICGIPVHAANRYIQELIQAGRKVATCNQDEGYSMIGAVNRYFLNSGFKLQQTGGACTAWERDDGNGQKTLVTDGMGSAPLQWSDPAMVAIMQNGDYFIDPTFYASVELLKADWQAA